MRTLLRYIVNTILFIPALLLLFLEWGKDTSKRIFAWVAARFRPLAALERWLKSLGPYPALCMLMFTSAPLWPAKALILWLALHGFYWTSLILFIVVKFAGTATFAWVFNCITPALMQIGWFATSYTWFSLRWESYKAMVRASWPWRYARFVKEKIKRGGRKVLKFGRSLIPVWS